MCLVDFLLDVGEGMWLWFVGLYFGWQFFYCGQGGGMVWEVVIGDDVEWFVLQGFFEVVEIVVVLLVNECLGIGFGVGIEDLQGEVIIRLVVILLIFCIVIVGWFGGWSWGWFCCGGGGWFVCCWFGWSWGWFVGWGVGDWCGWCWGLCWSWGCCRCGWFGWCWWYWMYWCDVVVGQWCYWRS